MSRSYLCAVRTLLVLGLVGYCLLPAKLASATTYTFAVNGGEVSSAGSWTPGGGPPGTGDTGVVGGGGPITAWMSSPLPTTPTELQVLSDGTLVINGTIVANQNVVMMGGLMAPNFNRGYYGAIYLDSASYFGSSGGMLDLGGVIQDHGANAGKFIVGTSAFVSVSNTNTYSGGTEIQNGTLAVSGTDSLGTGDVSLLPGGTLVHYGATLSSRIIANGGLITTVANYTLNAPIGMKSDTPINTAAGFSSLTGVISDEGATPGKLLKQGTGTYFLSNSANTFSGGIDVQQGGIVGAATAALGSGGVEVQSGATILLLATATQGAGVLLHNGALATLYNSADPITALGGSSFAIYQDNRTTQNPMDLTGTVTMLTPGQPGYQVQFFQGNITGTGKLLYNGAIDTAQITDLQGVNSHQGGTEIQAGIIRISAGELPNVGTVRIDSGATLMYSIASDTIGGLAGTGTLELGGAALTVAEGVSPGNSPGTLTIAQNGSIILGGSSNSVFELGSLVGPNDQVLFSGLANLVLDGTLTIVPLPGIQTGTYTLFDLSGGTVTGSFDSLVFQGGISGFVSIGPGNDVLLTITATVPEPSTLVLGLLPLALVLRRRRAV